MSTVRVPVMSTASLQRGRRASAAFAVLALSLSLGGCLGRGASDATGSIDGSAAPPMRQEALRELAETQGKRFEARPSDGATALAYAQTLKRLDQTAQAAAVLQQAALRNPSDLALMGAYGKALADSGRYKEAAGVLAQAHRPERPDWRILSVQGAVADQLGDFAGAQVFYVAALKIAPGEPSVLSNQGLSYALARRLGEAERILAEAGQHPRADARVRQNQALVLGLQGKFPQAEQVLARDLPPAEVAANIGAIRKMVSQQNSWKALGQAEAARPSAPPSARLQAAL